MATTYANIRMHKKVGNDDLIMYPQTLDTNILVDTSNPSIPSSVNNIYDLVEGLGGLAFEDNLAVNVDTETEYAVLRITDDPTQSDSDLVASAAAVNAVNNSTVKLDTDQEVGGTKAFTDGINIGGTITTEEEEDPETHETVEVQSVTGGVDIVYHSNTDRVVFS